LKTRKASSTKPSGRSLPSSKNIAYENFPIAGRRLIRRVQNFAATHQLWNHGDSFVLGISGGPDSVCLLDIFAYLKGKYDFHIVLAHVNYGLRGRASDLDERFVKRLACRYDLPLFILRPKVTPNNNLEERLRDIRYQFFEKIRRHTESQHILTAHHEDDQAETFLLHLFRGSGLRGLSAMRPKNNFLIRPLLDTSRSDILDYITTRELSFRTDATNASDRFLRNKIRNKLLPLLEKEYAQNLRKRLAATASLVAEDISRLERANRASTQKIFRAPDSFSLLPFARLNPSEQRHFLIALFKKQVDNPRGTWITETQKMLSLAKNKNQTLTFPGLKILRKGDTVLLIRTH
jgi:tRNA(Ile)-lysidine synthase